MSRREDRARNAELGKWGVKTNEIASRRSRDPVGEADGGVAPTIPPEAEMAIRRGIEDYAIRMVEWATREQRARLGAFEDLAQELVDHWRLGKIRRSEAEVVGAMERLLAEPLALLPPTEPKS